MIDEVESVTPMSDRPHPRSLAKAAIIEHYKPSSFPPLGLAEIHDPNRVDLDHPAKALDVDTAVRSATWEVK